MAATPFDHDLNSLPSDQHVEMKHGEEIWQMFIGGNSFLHRSWRLSVRSSRFLWRTTLSQYMAWLPEWLQNIAPSCSVQQREIYDHGWPTLSPNLQSSNVFFSASDDFISLTFSLLLLKITFLIIRVLVTNGAQTADGIFSNKQQFHLDISS